jgi:hypothetical protein
LTAVLEGHEVASAADVHNGIDVIRAWVDMNESEMEATTERGFAKKFSVAKSPEFMENLIKLLREGLKAGSLPEQFAGLKPQPHKVQLTRKLSRSQSPSGHLEGEANALEYEFAALTTLKSNYRLERAPSLLPGTILRELATADGVAAQDNYWVCIQPSCDCARIENPRTFLFLKLALDNGRFDLLLPENSGFRKVRIVYRQYESKSIEFSPSEDGSQTVRGLRQDGEIHFSSTDQALYLLIAELKFEQAQRIINRYSTIQSRVGLNESEWLRRWAGNEEE